ncbi:MAG: MFS transporter [Sphingobium sp.]
MASLARGGAASLPALKREEAHRASAVPVEQVVDAIAFGPFHQRLLVLTTAVVVLDGFDVQLGAFAGPAILTEWQVGPAVLAPAMAASLVGMAIGTGIGGVIGDRLGRRPTLIGALIWFGIAAMLTAMCRDVMSLAILRLITGLGLGAAVPNATALVAEWMPGRTRNYALTVISVGVPCGGFLGAIVSSWLIPACGWQAVFLLGGGLPLLLSIAMIRALPESPTILVEHVECDREIALLISQAGGTGSGPFLPPPKAEGRDHVLWSGLRRSTIGMSIAFFATLMAIYALLSWVPILLSRSGFPMGSAIRGAMILNITGVAASFAFAWVMLRIGSRATLLAMVCAGITALGLWKALLDIPNISPGPVFVALAFVGATVVALQATLLTLSAHVFPARCRAAGIGYSITFGRIGAILSTFGAGFLLAREHGVALYFGMLAVALLLLVGGVLVIDRHVPRSGRAGRAV